ncbi:MAG: 2-octaprenyl-6-methoxyphenyl hydroxylase [Gammaproteobacteria bacterium HGW-Gammaproteobacteria-8]|nr:MAG: 2-octaprenyl-6-methoxyphenyl hydroxylase [Gammaproteobacteria bacterium HGW-Gammaproteobacteria-8]
MSTVEARHDILIAGGGLAGASLAIGLSRAGFDVAMVEAVERSAARQPSFDDRTLVINRASLNILSRLGICNEALPQRPIRAIEVSREGGLGHVCLSAAELGVERVGAVVVARELGDRLQQECRAADLTEYCPERVENFQIEDDCVRVRLGSGQRVETRLLVAADGTGSTVRQTAGIASQLHDYRQSAMIFNLLADPPSTDVAHERFTKRGPLAFLPQPDGRYGAVMIGPGDWIDEAIGWNDAQLLAWLERHAAAGFRGFSRPGRRVRYPLKLLRTEIPIGNRVVAIGNAANSVHPVSAQGLNLGLRDVAGLIEALDGASDPGAPVWLARYLALRRQDQAETVRYTDTLARAFSNPSLPFRLGTGLGLVAHAMLPGLRRQLAIGAMGFRGPGLRLAQEI